jgi:hypothetical protein
MELFFVAFTGAVIAACLVAAMYFTRRLWREFFDWTGGPLRWMWDRTYPLRRARKERKGKLPKPLAETERPLPSSGDDPRIVR